MVTVNEIIGTKTMDELKPCLERLVELSNQFSELSLAELKEFKALLNGLHTDCEWILEDMEG